ncbi:two-component system response regulator FixJ [Phenylobacterium haematophilum]|jgi:two-component system response regulator FixJ|uniref:Two-component system response regulator FixJ n=1 Tax=Phenylobacterium haematophilum TaxID=98513 RepID=A0A839ZWB2_9CAUL|nr:response regulator FixJ [Phenylobacterium haematophilum]MBB3889661.1 two-component system response regulator FixJ [Phenylobacterium haematophilum]
MADELVHVIDDDPAVRDSLAFLLETANLSPRTYDSAVAFLEALPEVTSGCVVTDVRMPEMTGIELVRRLKGQGFRLPIVMITGHADVPLAVEAMKAGVADFIEKPFDDDVLLAAIGAALRDGEKDRQGAAEAAEITARMDTLSGREREVLGGLVAGHANKVIAFDLGISPRTVEIYRANVMTKMKAASLSELVRMAMLAERG